MYIVHSYLAAVVPHKPILEKKVRWILSVWLVYSFSTGSIWETRFFYSFPFLSSLTMKEKGIKHVTCLRFFFSSSPAAFQPQSHNLFSFPIAFFSF